MAKVRIKREIENAFSTGEDFASLFEASAANQPMEGTVVTGIVVDIENENVIVDIGFKTEGRIALREFPIEEREGLKKGSKIEVYLERVENSKGEAIVSRERAVREESWGRLEKLHNKQENVKGVIFGRVKGGFTVDLEGAIAFLPGSQVDVRPVKDITPLMGIPQPFQILKMDRKRGNIVVSRRAILEETRSAERAEALSGIDVGSVLEGVVKNITDYGAFVDLGAVDGLLHVTDISWRRISHPTEVLSLGQKITVKVIKFDKDSKRISLGLKQLEESPWQAAAVRYSANTRHKGHITNITDYGVFVELEPGIEGLVHISEMSWVKKNVHPSKLVASGQEVEVAVLSIDPEKHRLSLGMKQCEANPWAAFSSKHSKGEVVEGEVKSITDFGLFVGIDNMDGLVHASDISWDAKPEEAIKAYNKGDKVKVIILDIDPEKERISLGIKQLSGTGPEKTESSEAKKGTVATFTVSAVRDGGIEVKGTDGAISFIKKAELSRDRVECRPERFSVGDRVDAKVVGVERDGRTPKLSIKAMEVDEQKQAIAEFGSADSGASLGGILGVALDTAKKKKAESDADLEGKAKKAKSSKKADEEAAEKSASKKKKKAE